MKYLSIVLLLLPFAAQSQNAGIEVKLNTGSSIYTNYAYFYSGYSKSYARINNQRGEEISIDRIKYIQGTDKNGNQRYFNPIRYSGYKRWGERTFVSERIKIYSTTNFDLDSPGKTGNIYIKDDRGFQELKYRVLKQDLYENTISMSYLKKANGIRTAQNTLWAVSVGLFITGVAQLLNAPLEEPGESVDFPPILILAAGTNLTAWLLESSKRNKFIEALQHYE